MRDGLFLHVLAAGLPIFLFDFGLSGQDRTVLFGLIMMTGWAMISVIRLVEKLSTRAYVDGAGVHRRDEDPVTFGYYVAFDVFGILAFIALATLAAFRFT